MVYRREIDGLRAIAVIPVILFHAGFQSFSGGFVGVDVFFVISGYLITTIILAEKHAGTFTLAGFYERRARRILPALFIVIVACVPFAWLWMLSSDFKDFALSLVAVSVFSSNILFWRETGYFDTAVDLKPMLHTWSLAVEEQYYLLFPLYILLTWRLGTRWIIGILAAVALLSLAVAQWGSIYNPDAAFFLLPTRGWELLIGVFAAFYLLDNDKARNRTSLVSQALGVIGLLLIASAVVFFDKRTPYPGFHALVPTLGTVLIILCATPKTFAGQILGSRPLVGLGLISYSAYLWHQPLFVFARLRSPDDPSGTLLLTCIVLTIVFACLTWRFIELPFRKKTRFQRHHVFALSSVATVFIFGLGLIGYTNNVFDQRRSKDGIPYNELDQKVRDNYGLSMACDGQLLTTSDNCRTSDQPEVLVWGDSYAMHLVHGILASRPDVKMIQMTKNVCGPFYGLAPVGARSYNGIWSERCLEFNDGVVAYIKQSTTIKYVVLSSPFDQYTSLDWSFLTGEGTRKFDQQISLDYFIKTLDVLSEQGITPIVFSPPPGTGKNIGRCLVKSKIFGFESNACDFSINEAESHQHNVNRFLEVVAKKHKVVWLQNGMCNEGLCKSAVGSTFLYRDSGHLSYEGSALIGKKMDFYKLITSQ